jgi:hypothetical protein
MVYPNNIKSTIVYYLGNGRPSFERRHLSLRDVPNPRRGYMENVQEAG